MSDVMNLCKDQSCPHCGFPETLLVVDNKTLKPLRYRCSSHKCHWWRKVKSQKSFMEVLMEGFTPWKDDRKGRMSA